MSGAAWAEEMLQQWKQSTQQGIEAWQAMVGRTPQPNLSQYWMPFFTQGASLLSQMVKEGGSPEALQLWKRFLDEGIEAWSKALEGAMTSEGFAAAFGKYLDQYLGATGPVHTEMKKAGETYLKALGLPSRNQIAEMTSQISWVESRIEELEAKIEGVTDRLASLQEALEKARREGTLAS
ncbi:MAG: hypothetical protein ACREJK_01025 [Candidatus Methylomirabilales bacterium]